jgi:uncharacterized membrane protein YphA (DoxX/SURF4 family)
VHSVGLSAGSADGLNRVQLKRIRDLANRIHPVFVSGHLAWSMLAGEYLNELTIPIFLFLGLATRIATLPLLGMILVIQVFVYPNAWPDHALWGSALILLLTRGPGALSVDHLIERYFAKK